MKEHEIISAYAECPRGNRICSDVLRSRDIPPARGGGEPTAGNLKVIPSPEEVRRPKSARWC